MSESHSKIKPTISGGTKQKNDPSRLETLSSLSLKCSESNNNLLLYFIYDCQPQIRIFLLQEPNLTFFPAS